MNQQRGGLGNSKQTSACKRSLSKTLSTIEADTESSCISASSQLPSTSDNTEVPKRKGDVEFELQLEMALSATAAENQNSNQANHMTQSIGSLQDSTPPMKKLRQITEVEPSSSSEATSVSLSLPLPDYYYVLISSNNNPKQQFLGHIISDHFMRYSSISSPGLCPARRGDTEVGAGADGREGSDASACEEPFAG